MMQYSDRLFGLMEKLLVAKLVTEANDVASLLEIQDIRNIQNIPTDHPLHDKLMKVLRPQVLIEDKLNGFNERLRVE